MDEGTYAIKRAVVEIILREAELTLSPDDRFLGALDCAGVCGKARELLVKRYEPAALGALPQTLRNGDRTGGYFGYYDFGHTCPDWQTVLTLGLVGLQKRAQTALTRRNLTERQREFYGLIVSHYDAAFAMLDKMATLADEVGVKDGEMAKGLRDLRSTPPRTLYQAMQTMLVYYTLQAVVDDNNVRAFGRLDELLYPFYQADLDSGRLTKESGAALTRAFLERMAQFRAIANIPFAICGEKDGRDRTNAYSYVLLEEFLALASPDVKIHILYSEKTPADLVKKAIAGIIRGSNSIVFMNDERAKAGLVKLGIEKADAENYAVVGCYEPSARWEVPCSCNGIINLGKALEATLNSGRDMRTGEQIGADAPADFADFAGFYAAFQTQLRFFAESAMAFTNAREGLYPLVNTGGFFSSTLASCMEQGKDAYADYGAKYESSSLNANGLATAVDGVLAVKKLVFDEKRLTFPALCTLMRRSWEGEEGLRLSVKNKLAGYGVNDGFADGLAQDILRTLSSAVNGAKNAKGGVFRLGGFSVDNRFWLGERTAATPDGRRAGEPLSKNLCANLWTDREGVTAHILSASALDSTLFPNGGVLDLVLHESAVRGEAGREIFYNTLRVFMARGGLAVHYNVLSPAALREAQVHPERYPNLQIRLCGWNVLFSTLSKKVQDEFIYAAERRE